VAYDAVLAETVGIRGHGDDLVEAYTARPMAPGPRGGVIVIHHMPGYDRESKEVVRRFAVLGYDAICVNLYSREAPGAAPDDAAATARAQGGVPDERFVGDATGAARWLRDLPTSNGKVGSIGYCSGGRQAFLTSVEVDVQAAVDCYGAFVVNTPPEGAPLKVTPLLDIADRLSCPLLGLFGADDTFPGPEETAKLSAELDRLGKPHEFHTYEGAGHAFFSVNRPAYRPEAATDGWARILDFYGKHLAA
jgi:carboxymethylenebutenolidase